MAVPYRAKDTASDRSEFGHPDVAILKTHLSYYMTGLNFSQFEEALRRLLSNKLNAKRIYAVWIAEGSEMPLDLRAVECVNIADLILIQKLHSLLQFNLLVINFWLSSCVLPLETKQFPEKLFASSWDLVASSSTVARRHVTVGFSGTNDTRILLPTPIQQEDLVKLKHTNYEVIDFLVRQYPIIFSSFFFYFFHSHI